MRVMVWQYQSDTKQKVVFRGRVREYKGAQYIDHPCAEVRSSRGAAMRDAERLKIELKKHEIQSTSKD